MNHATWYFAWMKCIEPRRRHSAAALFTRRIHCLFHVLHGIEQTKNLQFYIHY